MLFYKLLVSFEQLLCCTHTRGCHQYNVPALRWSHSICNCHLLVLKWSAWCRCLSCFCQCYTRHWCNTWRIPWNVFYLIRSVAFLSIVQMGAVTHLLLVFWTATSSNNACMVWLLGHTGHWSLHWIALLAFHEQLGEQDCDIWIIFFLLQCLVGDLFTTTSSSLLARVSLFLNLNWVEHPQS